MNQRKNRVGGSVAGQSPHLRLRLSQLEGKLQALADVTQNNTDVFASGFDAADRRIYAMMRVIQDIACHKEALHVTYEVHLVPGVGRVSHEIIDWNQYFTEYEAMRALVCLAETYGPTAQVEETEEEDPATLVFGGDA